VEAQVGDLLENLEYSPSGHPPVVPSSRERLQLAVAQRQFTWSTRFQRFGMRDPLIDTITRRLGLPELGRAARRRMDEATRRYVK